VRNKIVFTFQVDFAMPGVAYARGDHHEFICFREYLLWVKANEVNYVALLSQRVQRSERGLNIKYLQATQRTRLECKAYVIGREITSVLKTAEGNAILEFNESSRTALECALRCECKAKKTVKSL